MSETLDVLDRRWRNACKVLFGQEVGALKEYMEWLGGMITQNAMRKSSISGKEVAYAIKEYSEGSRWVSFDEAELGGKYSPLNINEIKDIESLVGALGERAAYAGNIVLGNCGNVEKSSSISDSFFMHNTALLGDSKYCANCSTGRLCEDSFGTYGPGESQFCIRCTQTYRDRRCFELWVTQNCSDSYYSYNLNGCSDCIFCFNAKNLRHAIGNLQLGREKYLQVKKSLLLQMVQELQKKKKLPSLMDIVSSCKFEKPKISVQEERGGKREAQEAGEGKRAVEEEFGKTTQILFGKRLGGIDAYAGWLQKHTNRIEERKSAASGARILVSPVSIAIGEIPRDRVLTTQEALALGSSEHIGEEEAMGISLSNAHVAIGKLAFFTVDFCEGQNTRLCECTTYIESALCYRSSAMVYSKYCGYTFYPRSAQHAFGCNQIFDSSFCINCYYSVKLTRCFEMDSCRGCSDCLFCHNCENVHDSMFCFNAKNLKNAIGNVQLAPEEYARIKKLVLAQIASGLEKNRDLKLDIYNVGAGN